MTVTTARDERGRPVYVIGRAAPPRRARYLAGTDAGAMAARFAEHTRRRPAPATSWKTWADGTAVRDAGEVMFRVRFRQGRRERTDALARVAARSPFRNGVREEDVRRSVVVGGRRIVVDEFGVMAFAGSPAPAPLPASDRPSPEPAGPRVPEWSPAGQTARSDAARARIARLQATRTRGRSPRRVARDDAALLRTGGVHVL